MTTDLRPSIRASRLRVPRTRGAFSGLLLLILGAWAGVVAFIGPYFDLAYTPAPNSAWHWTAGRGWLEVAPGAAAFLGGLILLLSASRVVTIFGSWLAIAGGAWLVVGPALAGPIGIDLGTPDPTSGSNARAAEAILFFYGIGAAIVFVASLALGRLSVHSVRDVQAAERRAAEEQAAVAEQRRLAEEQAVRDREERERAVRDGAGAGTMHNGGPQPEAGRHERVEPGSDQPTVSYQPPSEPAGEQPTRAYTPAPPEERR